MQRNAMSAPFMQVVDMQLAVAGIESEVPIYRLVKDMRTRLTADASSRQLLEAWKPRMGAHLLCCERCGVPARLRIYVCINTFTCLPMTAWSSPFDPPTSLRHAPPQGTTMRIALLSRHSITTWATARPRSYHAIPAPVAFTGGRE